MFRLNSISPALAESFKHASPAHQRKAALVACRLAVSRAGLEGEEVVATLEHLRTGERVSRDLLREVESIAARFDAQYLRLDEEGDEERRSEMLQLFSKARAATALVFALSADSEQLHEAIYESLAAVDDASEFIRTVAEALEGSSCTTE